jgi:hypothetical protein
MGTKGLNSTAASSGSKHRILSNWLGGHMHTLKEQQEAVMEGMQYMTQEERAVLVGIAQRATERAELPASVALGILGRR